MDPKSKEFKALRDKWYKKLEKDGFKDIEQDEDHLKRWDSQYFIAHHTAIRAGYSSGVAFDATWFTSQEEYFQLAGAFLHEHEFKSPKEKMIWEMHASGMPSSEIYETLKKNKRLKVYRQGVYQIVNRLADVMVNRCRPKKT